jgi:rhodanese-related sulfurtransferase
MWKRLKDSLHNLSFDEFCKAYSNNENAVCIDARTFAEYELGHLPNSINVDYLSPVLADLLEELDPDRCYYVYCRTSRRSLRICVLLKNMGFQNIFHLGEGVQSFMHKLA